MVCAKLKFRYVHYVVWDCLSENYSTQKFITRYIWNLQYHTFITLGSIDSHTILLLHVSVLCTTHNLQFAQTELL